MNGHSSLHCALCALHVSTSGSLPRLMLGLAAAHVVALAGTSISTAKAQSSPPSTHHAAIVVATIGAADAAPRDPERALGSSADVAIGRLETSLAALPLGVFSAEEARALFEANASAPAASLTATDIERWASRSQSAVRHLARAEYDRAREELLEAQALTSRAAEELNREAERARQVLDTCLYMVRAYIETRDVERAEAQARTCRRLVPGAEPSPYRHTPEVRDLLARVEGEMRAEPRAELRVTSQPTGCAVRLNGISFGETPFRIDELAPGEYRLQVECGGVDRGRIRRLHLASGRTEVNVDTRFEAAIRSRPRLSLRYETPEDAQRWAARDAREIARATGASETWILWRGATGTHRLDRVWAEGAASAYPGEASLEMHSGAEFRAALSRLRVGESVDLGAPDGVAQAALTLDVPLMDTGHAPEFEGDGEPGQGTRMAAPERERHPVGLALVSSAAALTYGVASFLHAERVRRGRAFAQLFSLTRQRDWVALRMPSTFVAAGGSVVLLAAFPALLPDARARRVPIGAWVSGGVGLGLAGAAVIVTATRRSCDGLVNDRRACIRREEAGDRAILLASGAAPLVSVPVVYALRRTSIRPEVSVGRRRVRVGVLGTF